MTGTQSAPVSARVEDRNRSSSASRGSYSKPNERAGNSKDEPRPEPKILGQFYFKSVGPRTYAAQIKEASNGNHFVVLTEGRRDEKTDDVRKTRLFIFSEDFESFFKMLEDTARFIKANPVPAEVRRKRENFWAKQGAPRSGGR